MIYYLHAHCIHVHTCTCKSGFLHIFYFILFPKLKFSVSSHPPIDRETHKLEIPLLPDKDITYDLTIRTFVGRQNRLGYHYESLFSFNCSSQFHVFEMNQKLFK